jgi:hypothetical protein
VSTGGSQASLGGNRALPASVLGTGFRPRGRPRPRPGKPPLAGGIGQPPRQDRPRPNPPSAPAKRPLLAGPPRAMAATLWTMPPRGAGRDIGRFKRMARREVRGRGAKAGRRRRKRHRLGGCGSSRIGTAWLDGSAGPSPGRRPPPGTPARPVPTAGLPTGLNRPTDD